MPATSPDVSMALIIPEGLTTYGDATSTEGAGVKKYILAQFRSDAKLRWVLDLRTLLGIDELKWEALQTRRAWLKASHPAQWSAVEEGMRQASIVVIDPEPVQSAVRQSMGATQVPEDPKYRSEVVHNSALAIVGATPIAYLPNELDRCVDWSSYRPVATLTQFAPAEILLQLGGPQQRALLRRAVVFAARAHATFDVAARDASVASTRDLFRSPLASVLLRELLSINRVFDNEDQASVAVLNRAAGVISERISAGGVKDLVGEADSKSVDELQAADVAAGWARSLLDLGQPPDRLAWHFGTVWVNGRLVAGERR